MATLIDGKNLADKILLDLKNKVSKLPNPPGLAVVLIGENPASKRYVRTKKKAASRVGIIFHDYFCASRGCLKDISQEKILEMIDFLNKDDSVDGIIVQLPIPKRFETQKIINAIDPAKDVDGFHPENVNKFMQGKPEIAPPLIQAVNLALQDTGQKLAEKKVVIIGKNSIFYDALKNELEHQKMKVKVVNPEEKNLADIARLADVLVSIAGRPGLIKKEMVKEDAIVIDIGTTLVAENKWAGDIDSAVGEIAGYLTPVPGGIGPLTVACLLNNCYQLAKKKTRNPRLNHAD